jgi:hypothetical protein
MLSANKLSDVRTHSLLLGTLLLQIIGILANMTTFDLPVTHTWAKLLKDYNLLSLFSKMLVPGMAQNDVLLELIMMISSIAADPQVSVIIISWTMKFLLNNCCDLLRRVRS